MAVSEEIGKINIQALTVRQPHASLIFSYHKKHETRSWPCPKRMIGKTIAIHAGLNDEGVKKLICNELPGEFEEAIKQEFETFMAMPMGKVLGIVEIKDCVKAETINNPGPFGDFSKGMWAWELKVKKIFKEPIPAVGKQGFWWFTRD